MRNDVQPVQSFDQVRERVLEEHADLRRLLHGLTIAARAILDGATTSEIELHAAITAVALAFDRHCWTEEKEMTPLFAVAGGWGTRPRPRIMLDEHRQQRDVVFALLSEATTGEKAGAALAEDAHWLAESLTKDVHAEDELLLGLDGDAAGSPSTSLTAEQGARIRTGEPTRS